MRRRQRPVESATRQLARTRDPTRMSVPTSTLNASEGRLGAIMSWERRLPAGVTFNGRTRQGFSIGVSMPVGDDGLSPCVCPADKEHRFKAAVLPGEGDSDTIFCPYCGHSGSVTQFMPAQMARARAAMEQAAAQYMHAELDKMLGNAFGRFPRSTGSGISFSYTPARPPSPRPIPTFEVEPTRRSMQCIDCQEQFAVYSLAMFCPACGRLAPAQQLAELIKVERERLDSFDHLDDQTRRTFIENGVVSTTYEATIKNGFTALETYLKDSFARKATSVQKAPPTGMFQRLDDANDLYRTYLGLDLAATVGTDVWTALQRLQRSGTC